MHAHKYVTVKANPKIQEFGAGDTVKVNFRVREGDRERIQAYQGVVIKRQGGGPTASFTVRRITQNIGIERTFPMGSPLIESVEVLRRGDVRRARIYYLRGRSGKAARIKERSRFAVQEAKSADGGQPEQS